MVAKQFFLGPNQVLLVNGPARVSLEAGAAEVLGIRLEGQPIVVRKGKSLPIEPVSSKAAVKIEGGGEVSCQVLEAIMVGAKIWKSTINQIVRHLQECQSCSIVLVGPTDSGKSTFATFLSNSLLATGFKVNFVDADIGQNDIGPPGSIAIGTPKSPFTDLRDLIPRRMTFVGYTSAGLTFKPILHSLAKALLSLKDEPERNSVTLVNTDGFVHSEGLQYKLELLKTVQPHLVVAFSPPVFEVLSRLYQGGLIEAALPGGIEKDHTERSLRRMMQYNRFLVSARPITVDLSQKKLKFLGYDFDTIVEAPAVRAVRPGILNLIHSLEPIALIDLDITTAVISRAALKSMFVGLGDEESVHSFGLVSRLDGTKLKIETPAQSAFPTLYLGIIRIIRGDTESNTHLRFLER